MPARSEDQRRAAAMAYKARKSGDLSDLKGPARQMAEGMTMKELEEFMKKPGKGKKLKDWEEGK